MNRKLIAILMACFLPAFLWAARVDTLSISSPAMKRSVRVVVIVPDQAAQTSWPTLYLLHGHGGNERSWLHIKPDLPEKADRVGMIIVCPDGRNSWYWDSPLRPSSRYETFISRELPAAIDSLYPTLAHREARAITGYSMGGHGAMWNGIRHSDVFSAVGSISGGLDIRPFPKNWNMSDELGEQATHRENWETHTSINLVPFLERGRIAIAIDCGENDFFLRVNQDFHAALLQRGIDHDFTTRPGAHNEAYWNNAIDYQLLFFQKHFERYAAER